MGYKLPKEGEVFDIRGGIGNKLIIQITRKDGILFTRDSIEGEWKEFKPCKSIKIAIDNLERKNKECQKEKN